MSDDAARRAEYVAKLEAECERHRRANLVRAVIDGWGNRDDWITEVINNEGFDAVPWMVAKDLREKLARFEKLLAEKDHVIQFANEGWTISHPLSERLNGSLFDCKVHWDWDDPGVRGRFWLVYDEDGDLVLGDHYPEQSDGTDADPG